MGLDLVKNNPKIKSLEELIGWFKKRKNQERWGRVVVV